MILRAFKDKFIRLAREEDGVALVVTLAVFFFIYLICMGVYAVGTNVRERIHLQNACDAAAYSAAVVQADTLSRIATINRAMSWTYVQMTRRQMDYIVWRWLDVTVREYEKDLGKASDNGGPGKHGHEYWNISPDEVEFPRYNLPRYKAVEVLDKVKFHDSYDVNIEGAEGINTHLATFVNENLSGESFYGDGISKGGIERLQDQIEEDKSVIAAMNDREYSLQRDLHEHMDDAAREILKANLCYEQNFDKEIGSSTCYHLEAVDTPMNSYMRYLSSDEEGRFLKWWKGVDNDCKVSEEFETGIDDWFVINTGDGFKREYKQSKSKALQSSWHWKTWSWDCPGGIVPCTKTLVDSGRLPLKAEDRMVYQKDYFVGEHAKPMILTEKYFGEEGTVSVRVARKNVNPFVRLLRGFVEADGIFAAFNPFVEWTFAVASAKAGYRRWNWDANQPVEEDGEREYRIDWREDQTIWNLCTSDWDAVLIPVRMAKSDAKNEEWTLGRTGFLSDWMTGDWEPLIDGGDAVNARLQAGGKRSQEGDWDVLRNESAPDQQWWNWKTPLVYQTNESAGNRVDVEWQVGESGRGQNVKWESLTERIFH